MMKAYFAAPLIAIVLLCGCNADAQTKNTDHIEAGKKPNLRSVPADLIVPPMVVAKPAAGKRIKMVATGFEKSAAYHCMFLPNGWAPKETYPIIVEYAGNGTYKNNLGDVCNGKLEECNLGYGISGGSGVIWICLPFISKDKPPQNQLQWWGDVEATKNYCHAAIADVCKKFGGDKNQVFIAGFSRGAIACNYIGLHDDKIAALWKGFICHSHYDGVAKWNQGVDQKNAGARLARLGNRAQFISHESSTKKTMDLLKKSGSKGQFTFQAIDFPNHSDQWVLRDIPERKAIRKWFWQLANSDSK